MTVRTPESVWVGTPEKAVLLPTGLGHQIKMSGMVEMRSLFLSEHVVPDSIAGCCLVDISPILRELLRHEVNIPRQYSLSNLKKQREKRPEGILKRTDMISTTYLLHYQPPFNWKRRLEVNDGLADFVRRLVKEPGIGPWIAHYLAMRGFSQTDAFPASDPGIIKKLSTDETPLKSKQIETMAESWRQWRAYAAIFLWQE